MYVLYCRCYFFKCLSGNGHDFAMQRRMNEHKPKKKSLIYSISPPPTPGACWYLSPPPRGHVDIYPPPGHVDIYSPPRGHVVAGGSNRDNLSADETYVLQGRGYFRHPLFCLKWKEIQIFQIEYLYSKSHVQERNNLYSWHDFYYQSYCRHWFVTTTTSIQIKVK